MLEEIDAFAAFWNSIGIELMIGSGSTTADRELGG